jgi:anti-anti-sigma factor
MFSVGYFNKSMVIYAINIRRINFQNIEKLRRLVIQLLQNQCKRIVLDLSSVRFIDSQAFDVIDRLNKLANSHNIKIEFANIHSEVKELFNLVPSAKEYEIVEEVISSQEPVIERVLN